LAGYHRQWGTYRRWRNLSILALVAIYPAGWLGGEVGQRFKHPDNWFLAFLIGWLLLAAVVWGRFDDFRCPRCGKHFFHVGWSRNFFARKCVHCGLKKYSNG